MYHKTSILLFLFLLFVAFTMSYETAYADQGQDVDCTIDNQECVLERVLNDIQGIDNQEWKDQSTHDVAHLHAKTGQLDKAIKLIAHISTDELKAKTIRIIGMSVKGQLTEKSERSLIFTALHVEAKKIANPTAFATALKNVAISEAYSGDHESALKKIASIDNQAFRNMAYAEVAQVEAQYGTWAFAHESLEKIDNQAVKSKAYETIAKILADRNMISESYEAAQKITNAYQKSQAILYTLNIKQSADHTSATK